MAITFNFQHPVTLPKRRKLKQLIEEICRQEGKPLQHLDVIFCTDEFLLEINKTYLSHDYFTDIITFNLAEDGPIIGEVYISVHTAAHNAKVYNVLLFNELTRLIIHGTLHLAGYLDKSPQQKRVMTKKEDGYLSRFETL